MSSAAKPPIGPKEEWGISLAIPGTLDKDKDAEFLNTVKELLPKFVESLGRIHGVDASGANASIKRATS